MSVTVLCSLSAQTPVTYSNETVEQTPIYQEGNGYQKDVLLFFDMLGSTHPAFAEKAEHPFDIGAVCGEAYQWALGCESPQQLWAYLQQVISPLNDGHTTMIPDYGNSLIYPFMFQGFDDGYYLHVVARQHEEFLGKQITMMNDKPVEDVVDSFRPLFCCENDIRFDKMIRDQISVKLYWDFNPYRRYDSLLKLSFSDGSSIFLEPISSKGDLVSATVQAGDNSIRENSKQPFLYKMVGDENICYMQFNACMDRETVRLQLMNDNRGPTQEQIDAHLSRIPNFGEFLEEMFAEITGKGIQTLVVDVRGNPGGNSNLCNMLLSWLYPYDQLQTDRIYIRLSWLWEQNNPRLAQLYKEYFEETGLPYRLGDIHYAADIRTAALYSYSETPGGSTGADNPFVLNTDKSKIFGGQVIFIQDEGTYSSAGQLITYAVDNNIGIVVGSESSFRPSNYVDMLMCRLPNSGLQICVSHKIFYRPDHSKQWEASIIPNHTVTYGKEDFFGGNDLYWAWILENHGTVNVWTD